MLSKPIRVRTKTKFLNLQTLSPSDIEINDIAHSLSKQDRYNGACPEHYSVGEHAPLVARLTKWKINQKVAPFIEQWSDDDKAMCCLGAVCHDNPEYITGDLIRPIKRSIEGFDEIEDHITPICEEAFGLELTKEMRQLIKEADDELADLEMRFWFPWSVEGPSPYRYSLSDLTGSIKPGLPWRKAKKFFLTAFHTASAGDWKKL